MSTLRLRSGALTFASVARNAVDRRVVFVPIDTTAVPGLDVDLRAAWRRADRTPALREVLDCLFAPQDEG
ncbi:hypothetical protein ABQF17_03235 [Mycolicibacterium elephantis]|uniref:hypothetical protein n=1 Tax=Mycolicibacterium elephantis TaxID=81858 RepID=UPI0007E9A970|nr:hypothetical protein [Mycolicibacterium elephantis]OBF00986.1 hypothetical protein A5776_09240 [Mycolicibacterium elephantis]